LQIHGLSARDRRHFLKQAQVSSWKDSSQPSCTFKTSLPHPTKVRRSFKKEPSSPANYRTQKVIASLVTKAYPEFNFRHQFSLLVVGPSQCGKTYFVQQILEGNRITYEERKCTRIYWYYNQWQDRYNDLKHSFGENIQFQHGLPDLSDDLSEISTKYNNIIILDDLMAEATGSPLVARLFTQGRHRNASVILLLQNMFPKGKFNTDISRNAQYLALFRSPSDRKQIGIIGERMFDRNKDRFMSAYYQETEKPFGYLLVDNKPDTPADKQVVGDIFGECYTFSFTSQRAIDKHVTNQGKTTLTKTVPDISWSDADISVWQNFTSGAQAVRKIPDGYHIIAMYKTSRNIFRPNEPGVNINSENYWPVKIRHHSTGRVQWVNLHEDEPTVRAFVKETLAE
jgi:hypothetical protein